MEYHPVRELLERPGPRKILAIDGGGIRGIIALGAVAQIERVLRGLSGNDNLVLADYFDFFAGTSTGAVIAAGLSTGMTAAKLEDLYVNHGPAIFRKSAIWTRLGFYKFRDGGLRTALQDLLGDMTLGSPRIRTLLMVVMRNATTDSPWLLTNNPRAKYADPACDDCNLQLPLWQVLRASAAAPSFFPPEVVELGTAKKYRMEFVDGATTPFNNPAFAAFLNATLDRYRIEWSTGTDNLLLISVGTGSGPIMHIDRSALRRNGDKAKQFRSASLLWVARNLPVVQMWGDSVEQDTLCRIFGDCLEGEPIDSEIDDLRNCAGPCSPKLFTYARYNVTLTSEAFRRYGIARIDPNGLRLDAYQRIEDLKEVGRVMARKVSCTHFAGFPLTGIPSGVWRERTSAVQQ